MTSERAIALLEIEKECIRRNEICNHVCNQCELVQTDAVLLEAYNTAIAALRGCDCSMCGYYDGVHNCAGHAPCSFENQRDVLRRLKN